MNRRAQTVRHRQSQSVAGTDDLGFVWDGEHNSIEDLLRQDLAAARRENEKLQSQVESLNAALRARPPIEKVHELEKEFQGLELLLHGTQRENERAMAELERVKSREKLMERELKRFAGDDWEETLNIGGNFLSSTRPIGVTMSRIGVGDASASSASAMERPHPSTSSAEATLAHMEQIRVMLMGMSERLQGGEERLQQAIERAEQEKKQLDDILITVSDGQA
ncbi:hypothetical protein BU17DRAFT_39339 [Hysterangium stoloniferum]|nr:hypothetical protein BU17DRAFT_39339 [Hysterangium stoloniferum]